MEKTNNYLENIPIPREGLQYGIVDGKVTIYKENTGFFNKLAQLVFKKPRISQIHLDEMGNFVWPLMDGSRDIEAIARLIGEKYGEKAEPLYERAAKYFQILVEHGFVEYKTGLG